MSGATTAPLHSGYTELVVSLKTTAPTTSHHRVLAATAGPPDNVHVNVCRST